MLKKPNRQKLAIGVPSKSIFKSLAINFDVETDRNKILSCWPVI